MLGTTNGDVLGGFGTSSSYKKGEHLEAALRPSATLDGIADDQEATVLQGLGNGRMQARRSVFCW